MTRFPFGGASAALLLAATVAPAQIPTAAGPFDNGPRGYGTSFGRPAITPNAPTFRFPGYGTYAVPYNTPLYSYGAFYYGPTGFTRYGASGFTNNQSTFSGTFDGGFSASVPNGGFYNPFGYMPAYGYGTPTSAAVPYNGPVIVTSTPPAPPPLQGLVDRPAVLTIDFPAKAEVWLNGKLVEGAPATEQSLTSPPLPDGEKFKFEVRAEWKEKGKVFEYVRTVTLAAGERSKVTVVAGTPVADAGKTPPAAKSSAPPKIEPAK
jgi:uncharacterized protein (TIGR03000 family)